ncbi:MAG: YkgJ family cysteine cluster protein, partial [Planctomycetes bacterium]|nr:YkgJ family cysteine cluster protein [Planctomycetota bacterium]
MSGRRKDGAGAVWYVEGVSFECTRCGDCCRGAPGYVWVSPREVERIAGFLGLEAATFRRQFVRKVGARLSLKEGEDGDCVFYQEGCLIYPVRPTQCAIFPFWESNLRTPREWEQLALRCPGVNRGALHSATQIRMSLRADRASVSGRALPVPTVTSAALVEVQRLYRQVEGALAGECVRCGDCCRFGRGVPTLFASLLEVALVLRWLGEAPRR